MYYLWQHIFTIISRYDGGVPLSVFIKNYYRQFPILGSRDRKILSNMAYSWYRCSKGFSNIQPTSETTKSIMKGCLELCNYQYSWLDAVPVAEGFTIEKIFLYPISLSHGISLYEWLQNMLVQPALFIRVTGVMNTVIGALEAGNIAYTIISDTCLSLPNVTNLDKLLSPRDYVIQDASSQETGKYMHPKINELWFDCCAGAGGKSLMLLAKEPTVKLTVSDTRKNILANLRERFQQCHYPLPEIITADAANTAHLKTALGNRKFEHIICDVPCTGSGTWARTPEQMYFFNPDNLGKITAVQKAIASNVLNYLLPGGKLYYITCSVFRHENEDVVEQILKQGRVVLENSELINGISKKADSMYIAVLVNS